MSSLIRRQQIRTMKDRRVEKVFAHKAYTPRGVENVYFWPRFAPKLDGVKRKPAKRAARKAARWNGKAFVRQMPLRRPTFAVPAQPVRSTRAERQAQHKAKMLFKRGETPNG